MTGSNKRLSNVVFAALRSTHCLIAH